MPRSLTLRLPREEPLLLQPGGSPRVPWTVNDFFKLISNSSPIYLSFSLYCSGELWPYRFWQVWNVLSKSWAYWDMLWGKLSSIDTRLHVSMQARYQSKWPSLLLGHSRQLQQSQSNQNCANCKPQAQTAESPCSYIMTAQSTEQGPRFLRINNVQDSNLEVPRDPQPRQRWQLQASLVF